MRGLAMKSDTEWEAEEDARVLSRSQEVRNDAKRYKRAMTLLQKQAATASKAVTLEQKVKQGLKTLVQ
jgi:hypothetical protein